MSEQSAAPADVYIRPWWLKNQKPIKAPLKTRPIPRDTIEFMALHRSWFRDLFERKFK
jgi:hypothetical protein